MLTNALTVLVIVAMIGICYLVGKKADNEVGTLLSIWLGGVYVFATLACIAAVVGTYLYLQPVVEKLINY